MGMFDTVTVVDYPLPDNIKRDDYQTKSFDFPWLDLYEIRADGSLWKEDYDIEDRSDPTAEGYLAFVGMMTKVNKRWNRCSYTGELVFYDYDPDLDPEWVEFKAILVDGRVQRIERIHEHENWGKEPDDSSGIS